MPAEEAVDRIDLEAEAFGACRQRVGEELRSHPDARPSRVVQRVLQEVERAADIELEARTPDFFPHPDARLLGVCRQRGEEGAPGEELECAGGCCF